MSAATPRHMSARLGRQAGRALDWIKRRRRRAQEAHGLVLMYHRIATVLVDPWKLAVTPFNFEDQIRTLRQHVDIVPLSQLCAGLRQGRASVPVVAITFDDGYLDNLTVAKPVLERYAAPATVFVPTGYVGSDRSFWWDRLARLLLAAETLPTRLALDVDQASFQWNDELLSRSDRRGLSARRRLHDSAWRWLCDLSGPMREHALGQLSAWTGRWPAIEETGRPMRRDELRALVKGWLIDVGAHSVSHPMLAGLTSEEKAIEIGESRTRCAELTGKSPTAFAFPSGNFDEECVTLVREAGFDLACTSRQDLVWAGGDVYRMPRISVSDVSGKFLLRRLSFEWLP